MDIDRILAGGACCTGSVALLLATLALVPSCGPTAPAQDSSAPVLTSSEHVAMALPAFREARGRRVWPAPTPPIARLREALAAGDGARARELVADELERNPDSPEVLLFASQLHYARAEMAAARPGFERVLASGPTFEGAEITFYYYGGCLLRLGDGAGARASLNAHLELVPGAGETLSALGELHLQEGDADAALARFGEALEAFARAPAETRAEAQAGVARALFSQGEVEDAREALALSIELDPSAPRSYFLLSRILTRLGDRSGARHAIVDFKRVESGLEPRFYGREGEALGTSVELDE